MTRSAALESFLSRMTSLGDRLRTDAEALTPVAVDESGLPPGEPAAVLWPTCVDEVALAAREASSLGVPLVPRGGGTGKAGGCIPSAGEVVVDLTRMNRLLEIRSQDMYAVVQPGVITGDFDAAAGGEGFFYPPDPGSWESCTIGGNVATNAGGMRAVKYGVTQRYVWGLQVVLPGGDVLRVGRRSIKGVVGFDLTSLLVGSEGTLGFITEATLHIIPAPPAVETAWLTFPSILAASRAAELIFSKGFVPRVIEVMDRGALDAARPTSDFKIPEGEAGLLLEMDGALGEAFEELTRVCELAVEAGAVDSAIAQRERDREAMRRARRLVSSSLKEKFPFKLADDIAVPRSRIPELLERSSTLVSKTGTPFCAYGHLGDGNLHINLLCKSAEERRAAMSLRRSLLKLTVELGGTISGEHGIGLAKRDLLSLEQSSEVIDLQRRLKETVDPRGIMNPGKLFPVEI